MRHLVALVMLALGPAACSAEGGGSPSGRPCASSSECGDGFTCRDGTCQRVQSPDAGAMDGAAGDGAPIVPGEGGPIPGTDGGGTGDGGGSGDGGAPMRCVVTPAAEAFREPALELRWTPPPALFPEHVHVIVSPVVADLLPGDPDEVVPEIIFVSYETFNRGGVLRVIDGRAPHAPRWTSAGVGAPDDPTAMPIVRFDGHPAVGDIDGDRDLEIITPREGGGLIAFSHLGEVLWDTVLPANETEANGSVALADLEGDGTVEAVVGRVVLDALTGTVRWTGTAGRGANGQGPLSCVADLDEDGSAEVIAGNTVYRADGTILWQTMAGGDGFCAVADVVDMAGAAGRDTRPEVIRVAGGTVYIHDGLTGMVRHMIGLPGDPQGSGGAPTVADFDGDGRMEIGVAGAIRYAVLDPECVGASRPMTCAANGILWRVATEDDSSNVTSSTVFDFNGDGRAEVVYNDEQYFRVYDGQTGMTLFEEPSPSRTRTEQPVIADVDADGNAEIVFSSNTEADFAGDSLMPADRTPGLEIWSSGDDAWVGARAIWNQHTYHIDNVTGPGGIPMTEMPSWRTHNTYRLNRAEEDVLLAPDLAPDPAPFDTSRCGMGILEVCATVTNRGEATVGPGIEVDFYDGDPAAGGTLIGTATTTGGLLPGRTEIVCTDWSPAPTTDRPVYARVDTGMAARECLEDNNTALVGMRLCSGPM
ncbi:MAG: hypothetical protein IT379_15955 [Deltaproteobacteria bacterium]|nr:hypothetical protein [Deltaproteobacteria bacterium]